MDIPSFYSRKNLKLVSRIKVQMEKGLQDRALRDKVSSIRTVTGKFAHLVPQMRLGPGTLYLETHCPDRDWE